MKERSEFYIYPPFPSFRYTMEFADSWYTHEDSTTVSEGELRAFYPPVYYYLAEQPTHAYPIHWAIEQQDNDSEHMPHNVCYRPSIASRCCSLFLISMHMKGTL